MLRASPSSASPLAVTESIRDSPLPLLRGENIPIAAPASGSPSGSQATSCSPSPAEFVTPVRKTSRPHSPVVASTPWNVQPNNSVARPPAIPARGRIACIRRESDCSEQGNRESEAAHEKLVKVSHQVSLGFEDFCLDEQMFDERKRARSLTEPISILTNAFLVPPSSSSPSPTRAGAAGSESSQKQCYSPSTMQVVRGNISYYSPSPSPTSTTPNSPTRGRIMRSMSPIAVRQISKRRYTASGNNSGLESDGESSLSAYPLQPKRHCHQSHYQRTAAASPLIRDLLPVSGQARPPSSPRITAHTSLAVASAVDELLQESFCSVSSSLNNDSSTTSFSSRAETPNTAYEGDEEEGRELDTSGNSKELEAPTDTQSFGSLNNSFNSDS